MRNRRQNFRKRTDSVSSCCTLPDYSVEEDNFGRLINREKRLVWPSAKQLSCKEFARFLKNPPPGVEEKVLAEPSDAEDQKDKFIAFREKKSNLSQNEDVFVGLLTPRKAAEKIQKPTDLVLYYRVEKALSPLTLMMAHMSIADGSVTHSPILRKTCCREGELCEYFFWSFAGDDQKRFASLEALVTYHRLFIQLDAAEIIP